MPPPKKPRLNERQKRFIENYLKAPDDSATAYIQAGYRCKSHAVALSGASQLMKHPLVATEIAQRQAKAAEETNVTIGYVRSRLYTIVERCLQTQPVLDVLGQPTGLYEFRPTAAIKALDQLARHLGMYNDKLTVEQNHTHTHTHSLADCGVSVQDLRTMLESLRQRKTLPPGAVIEHKPTATPSPSSPPLP